MCRGFCVARGALCHLPLLFTACVALHFVPPVPIHLPLVSRPTPLSGSLFGRPTDFGHDATDHLVGMLKLELLQLIEMLSETCPHGVKWQLPHLVLCRYLDLILQGPDSLIEQFVGAQERFTAILECRQSHAVVLPLDEFEDSQDCSNFP